VVIHLEVRHVASPKILGDQDRGHRAGEQAGQADPEPEQDHRDESADRRLGLLVGPGEEHDPDVPERLDPGVERRVPPLLGQVDARRSRDPDDHHRQDDPEDLVPPDRQPEGAPPFVLGEQ